MMSVSSLRENVMKRTNIYLDEEQSRLLRHLAVEEGRSFTDIVREALNEYLARRRMPSTSRVIGPRRAIPQDEWRAGFDAALQRIRVGVPSDITVEEIESEISAARDEVRRERAARRRAPRA
jgi:hypothetical protein